MSRMEIQLPRKLKAYVDEQAARRGYEGASEYIAALVEADKRRDLTEEIEAMLLEAVDGPFEPWTDQDVQDIRRIGTKLIARRKRQRKTR